MAYKIKPGYLIMQGGKIYTEGCLLNEVEKDLMDMVEPVAGNQQEYQEKMVEGIPLQVTDKRYKSTAQKKPQYSTADVINNPEGVNPLNDLPPESSKK